MKRSLLAVLAATLLLSSGAWAGFSVRVDNDRPRHHNPPPPPPPRERLECRFEKPDCRPRERQYRVEYRNRRTMIEGRCDHGDDFVGDVYFPDPFCVFDFIYCSFLSHFDLHASGLYGKS